MQTSFASDIKKMTTKKARICCTILGLRTWTCGAPGLHHLLAVFVVIFFMSQGNLFPLFFGQCLSIPVAMPGGGIHDIVIATTLQSGE